MSAPPEDPAPREELVDAARALYSALLDARSYVYAASVASVPDADALLNPEAAALLERVDGALADAGELVRGVPS